MDIGFGDIITPDPQELEYPLLLDDLPPVNIMVYSLETVVAEKFHFVSRCETSGFNKQNTLFHYREHFVSLNKTVRSII